MPAESEQPRSRLQVRASADQQRNREQLQGLFGESPLPAEELVVNLPLYMRSPALAKVLYIDELVREIGGVPGVIMEFGVWWGANLVLFENLRAIHEPYNHTRRVIGFDTFSGYERISPQDGEAEIVSEGNYSVRPGYREYLEALLGCHEQENGMGHIPRHELVAGDASETVERYLADHPETIVALAYFDMQLYKPTRQCLEAILPRLVKGSVIAMDELNSSEFPGETVAFREVLPLDRYRMRASRFLPDRTIVTID